MSLSRGLSMNTQVRETTLPHQTYKHKTHSDTFAPYHERDRAKDHLPVSRRGGRKLYTDVNVILLQYANSVFHQISILEFLSRSRGCSLHSFCATDRSTSQTFPFRPQRRLAKLLLHYPEVFLSFGLSRRYSLEMTSHIRSKEGE